MRIMKLAGLAAGILFSMGSIACATGIAPQQGGSLYSSVKGNWNCNLPDEASCVGQSGPKAAGAKTGEACTSQILGLIQTGDMSLKTAASNGGISQVASIDYSQTRILGSLYGQNCIMVNGN